MNDMLTVILAGGKGSRLEPLTRDRAKPAVPFGGIFRIIDFAMSNCLNSGLRQILLLTQYKALSLDRHVDLAWRHYFCRELGEFIEIIPPQQRIDEHWYQGTADAVYQNIYAIEKTRPQQILILAGDHIYKMNYRQMLEFHKTTQADLTIAVLPVPLASGKQFGVIEVDERNRVIGFQEKPAYPKPIPDDPDLCLASMGIYIFSARLLFELLLADANQPDSSHDFGKDIIPSIVSSHHVAAFHFRDENRKSQAYWRDVGTLDAYYEANLDLIQVEPLLNLYDRQWPIRTFQPNLPPPKFVFADRMGQQQRVGSAIDSIVCSGSIISGGLVERSVVGSQVRVNSFATVSDCILLDRVEVGRSAQIRRAIIDKDVVIPEGAQIGFDLEQDRQRGFTISEGGIVVVGKADHIP
ncbi:MAG TPA: glucose-1-phosphate adenylyltransferase [Pirellulaceae bacterium]|nr:glucose-1-phosphate adenylyltransferase [Pirellulaceae bacterium]